MSATADSSCGELSEALQRNAKPRKRCDFHHPRDGLYAAKHEATLSNISVLTAAFNPRLKAWPRGLRPLRCSFASLRMT
jgi:hypothetical protein